MCESVNVPKVTVGFILFLSLYGGSAEVSKMEGAGRPRSFIQ